MSIILYCTEIFNTFGIRWHGNYGIYRIQYLSKLKYTCMEEPFVLKCKLNFVQNIGDSVITVNDNKLKVQTVHLQELYCKKDMKIPLYYCTKFKNLTNVGDFFAQNLYLLGKYFSISINKGPRWVSIMKKSG